MHFKLKALGLALVAALALSAVVTAGASAQTKHKFRTTSGQTAHLTAVADGPQVFAGNTDKFGKRYSCEEVSIEKGKGTVKDGAEEITATPKYDKCVAIDEEAGKESSAFPIFNGCDYHFFGTTTSGNPTGGEHANVEIRCPEGKEIEIRVTAFKLKCASIPPQLITDAVRYKNTTTEGGLTDVTVEATPHNVKNTTLNTAACPTPSGKPETHNNGTYKGNVIVTGFQDEAHTKPTGVSVEPGT